MRIDRIHAATVEDSTLPPRIKRTKLPPLNVGAAGDDLRYGVIGGRAVAQQRDAKIAQSAVGPVL